VKLAPNSRDITHLLDCRPRHQPAALTEPLPPPPSTAGVDESLGQRRWYFDALLAQVRGAPSGRRQAVLLARQLDDLAAASRSQSPPAQADGPADEATIETAPAGAPAATAPAAAVRAVLARYQDVFHELTRQVASHCLERGTALASLWEQVRLESHTLHDDTIHGAHAV